MSNKSWTAATRGNGHKIRNLWIRKGGTYYAQLAIFNPAIGEKENEKVCLKTRQLNVALERLAELKGEQASGELKHRDKGPKFKDYLSHFLTVRKNERDPKTVNNERCFLQQFQEFIGEKHLGEITVRNITDYRTKILDGGIVNHTANLHIIALRNFYKQAILEGAVDENPAAKIKKLKHTSKQKFFLPHDQIILLAKTATEILPKSGQQVSDWILTMAYCGGRASEVLSLKWSDVDFTEKKLHFRKETVKFKNRARIVDFNSKLEAQLREMQTRRDQQQDWLFPSSREKGSPIHEFGHDLAKVTHKLGITGVTSHFFRHYFISTCATAAIAVKVVVDWVGHTDSKMVMDVYTHLPDTFRKSEATKLTFGSETTKPKVDKSGESFFRQKG